MQETLLNIKKNLKDGIYKNEEHVRLSLVARIINGLDWNLWNPNEVNTEFVPIPTEDKSRVDIALFLNPYEPPSIFIEIKPVGKLKDNINKIEQQLRDYNRNNTALFSIITDGRKWRFYYSQTGGEFSQKCFKTLDIVNDDIDELETSFYNFLSKTEIGNGNAKQNAENYLQLSKKQKTMEAALSKARRLIIEPPYPNLLEALVKVVNDTGYSITVQEAKQFISEITAQKANILSTSKPLTPGLPSSHGIVVDQKEETYFYSTDVIKEKRIIANILNRRELWITFLEKRQMTSHEFKKSSEFKPKAISGFMRFLTDNNIASRKGEEFILNEKVISEIKKLIHEENKSIKIPRTIDQNKETYFHFIDANKKKRIHDNILNRRELWKIFLTKKKMTSLELKKSSEFRQKTIAGFMHFLVKNKIATRYGDVFTLNLEVVPFIEKILLEGSS